MKIYEAQAAEKPDLNHSRRNRVDLVTSDENIKRIAYELSHDINANRRRSFTEEQQRECQRHAEVIILGLMAAWQSDPALYVGYSRGKENFERDGCYWDQARDIRLVSYPYFISIIEHLELRGLIENHTAKPGRNNYSSRMRANKGLVELLVGGGSNWASIITDLDAPSIFVKNEDKEIVAYPDAGQFNIELAQQNLRRINENLQSSFLNLSISDDTTDLISRQKRGQFDENYDAELDDGYRQPIDFSNRNLRRKFALNSFEKGGRFYGGWWQQVPSDYRKFIEIEGMVTVELDFSTIQPRIMYALAGQTPPKDSYTIPGWKKALRPTIKKAFNQLINSAPSTANPNQWHRLAPTKQVFGRKKIIKTPIKTISEKT